MISSDFCASLKALPAGEHEVVAVAARSIDSAKKFAARHKIKKAYGAYVELSKDPDIDIVYVGVIQNFHLEVASMMMKAGKHMLCEKPLCMNVRETKELLAVAKQSKVFMMEAVWSRFFPAYKELGRRLKAGEIGDVVSVIASFGRDLPDLTRLHAKETGGGVTLDIALYPTQLTCLVMGGEMPEKILATGHLNENGVDETITASLLYSKRRVASITASFRADLPSEAYIVGTKGTLKVPYPIWAADKVEGPSGNFCQPLPVTGEEFVYPFGQGMMYEAMEVRRCIKEGLLESPGMTHKDTLTLATILESIRKQAGTVYPQDSV